MIDVRLLVDIGIDGEAWQLNYGTADDKLRKDIQAALAAAVQSLTAEWIEQTGNKGTVNVKPPFAVAFTGRRDRLTEEQMKEVNHHG